jgi:hypothetical protein
MSPADAAVPPSPGRCRAHRTGDPSHQTGPPSRDGQRSDAPAPDRSPATPRLSRRPRGPCPRVQRVLGPGFWAFSSSSERCRARRASPCRPRDSSRRDRSAGRARALQRQAVRAHGSARAEHPFPRRPRAPGTRVLSARSASAQPQRTIATTSDLTKTTLAQTSSCLIVGRRNRRQLKRITRVSATSPMTWRLFALTCSIVSPCVWCRFVGEPKQ